MVTRVLLLARVQFTHGVFLREKRSKAELWASRSVGPRLKTDVLSRATGKHNPYLYLQWKYTSSRIPRFNWDVSRHNPYLYYPPRLLPIVGYSDIPF